MVGYSQLDLLQDGKTKLSMKKRKLLKQTKSWLRWGIRIILVQLFTQTFYWTWTSREELFVNSQSSSATSLYCYRRHYLPSAVFSERTLKFMFAICHRLSVCLSSVTFVRPTQAIELFGNVSTPFGTLAICWHPWPWMTLNGVMAVTLRYFTEFGKPALQKTICGGIYAKVCCIFSACTMSS